MASRDLRRLCEHLVLECQIPSQKGANYAAKKHCERMTTKLPHIRAKSFVPHADSASS